MSSNNCISNEERREVARKLRSHNESSGLFDNAFLELFHEVVGRYPDMNLFRGKCETELLFKRLADLIEPEPERTCLAKPWAVERDTGYCDCTECECGEINDVSAKYCSGCGGLIKVVYE